MGSLGPSGLARGAEAPPAAACHASGALHMRASARQARPAAPDHSAWRPSRLPAQRRVLAQAAEEGKVLLGGVTAPVAQQLRIPVGGREIVLETGEIGRQAAGAVMVTDGETMVYTTVCADEDSSGDGSFAPLQVHYTERFSAAGRTSGGYLKREGKPKDHEVLVARLIDRPIRPMIQPGWTHSTQLLTWVLSYDGIHSPEPLAITAAGAALALSDVPLRRAVAGARVALLPDRGFVVNPTVEEQEASSLDLVIAGTSEAVLMIEGFCDFLTEEQMLEAVRVGHEAVASMCVAIEGWAVQLGKPKRNSELLLPPQGLDDAIRALIGKQLEEAYRSIPGKRERGEAVGALRQLARDTFVQPHLWQRVQQLEGAPGGAASEGETDGAGAAGNGSVVYDYSTVSMALKRVESSVMRRLVLEEGFRADGRAVSDVRPIWSRAQVLPRTHGSVLFTRGETQALAVTTLGCSRSAQRIDAMAEDEELRFYLQYSFPPSSVGETGRMGGPGRREVGHGNLAERALLPVVPGEDVFPYTIRVESTITESNGSSSMASVCGGCLSMLDAGVPLERMVAGVAMGLVLEPDGRFVVLTDILGSEDALGDMDFKVAGDEQGITAFQMDIKVEGITLEIMREALAAAGAGRRHILAEMAACSPPPRRALSQYAPRIMQVRVPADKVGLAIGPGGRNVKHIQESTGVEVQVDSESGTATLKGASDEACRLAADMLDALTSDPEIGRIYRGCRVTGVMPFGLFVEILPKREALLHISDWGYGHTKNIGGEVKEGDLVDVMVTEVQDSGKVKASRRAVLEADGVPPPPGTSSPAAPGTPRGGDSSADGSGSDFEARPPPVEVEVGRIYRNCRVQSILPFGAFVEVAPRRDGLLKVQEWDIGYTPSLDAVCKEGDLIDVMVVEEQARGKLRLSRKAALLADQEAGSDGGGSDGTVDGVGSVVAEA